MGPNRDWARVGGKAAIVQKLVLFFSIEKGSFPGEPDLGCCLHTHLFDKLTDNNLCSMGMELQYDLQKQIPELKVQIVEASLISRSGGEVRITIYSAYGTWILDASKDELSDINLLEEFGVAS
jgi:hypothetical protein